MGFNSRFKGLMSPLVTNSIWWRWWTNWMQYGSFIKWYWPGKQEDSEKAVGEMVGREKYVPCNKFGEMNTTKTEWVLWLKLWTFSIVWRKNHTHHRQKPLKVIRLKVYWGSCLDIRAGKYRKAGENCVMKSFVVCNWLACVGQPMSRREHWRCCRTAASNEKYLSRSSTSHNFCNSHRVIATAHGVTFQMLLAFWNFIFSAVPRVILACGFRIVPSFQELSRYPKSLFFSLWRCVPTLATVSSFFRFLYHTQRRTTVGRTPLDERSGRRRNLTTLNIYKRKTSMPLGGFEPTALSGERPQT